jgi:hypothetical protein
VACTLGLAIAVPSDRLGLVALCGFIEGRAFLTTPTPLRLLIRCTVRVSVSQYDIIGGRQHG